MNDPIIQLQAKLDKAKSSQSLNSGIQDIQRQLNQIRLQAEIDPESISALEKQLDNLLGDKVKIPRIEADETQVRQIGEKIGNTISSNLVENIHKASTEITAEIKKTENQMSNIQPSPDGVMKLFNTMKSKISEFAAAGNIKNIGKCRMSVRISKYCKCFEYALLA